MSRKMFVPFHADGIISQFEGYEDLEELDWEGLRARYGNIQRLDRILRAEGDDPMAVLGVARADDAERLGAAGADLVVTTLDDVALDRLAEDGLSSRPAIA